MHFDLPFSAPPRKEGVPLFLDWLTPTFADDDTVPSWAEYLKLVGPVVRRD